MKYLIAVAVLFLVVTCFIWPYMFVQALIEVIRNVMNDSPIQQSSINKMVVSLFFMAFPSILVLICFLLV